MTASGVDHAARADTLHRALQERFWQPRQGLYRVTESRVRNPLGPWHHWWQSQALSVLLDRYDRTGVGSVQGQADRLVEGMRRRGGGLLTNDFYDDMGWLGLELLRMPGHATDIGTLVAALRGGAMPEGGIAWAVHHQEFRNTPATGPAAILALRLGARGSEELASWGISLLRWMQDSLVGPDGDVSDGYRIHPDGRAGIDAARYSYNYGLVIGAELAAHALTADDTCLDRALVVASAAFRQLTDPATGVWASEGPHDRALFRGILARHVAELAFVTGDSEVADVLMTQADAVWDGSAGGPVGWDWPTRTHQRVELSEHVGGLLVVEAAARLG